MACFSFPEGGDFTALITALTFDPATFRLCKNITITDDNVPEDDETFTVTLTDSGITLSPDTATVTIVDNDGMCTCRPVARVTPLHHLVVCFLVFIILFFN